ncbi:hypothetical protein GCM10009636_15290 [Arthrobacter koreensis]|uniref:DUF2975 domain-containing protein n=1 Tax=Arthrobacter koreensis TaxID=199136 RepID=UPI00126415FD|nr:DUF2975 domain-containing protein [Arthrobacter koreensis]
MTKQEALPLRCVLAALGVLALLSQTALLPRIAGEYAEAYPEVANLAAPYALAVIAATACFEVALLAAWQMLTSVVTDGALTPGASKWANVLAFSLGLTGITLAGICAHAGFVEAIGGPAMLLGLLAGLALVPAAVALRNRVLRAGSDSAEVPGVHRWT